MTTEQFYKFKKESISALGERLMEATNFCTEPIDNFNLTWEEAQLLNDALTLYHDVVHYNSEHPDAPFQTPRESLGL
jgi:hypothetical protein